MSRIAKGTTLVGTQLHDWSEDDRNDAIEFALHPANGVTAVTLYLNSKGVKASITAVHKWLNSIREESRKVAAIRKVFDDYKGVTPNEINAYVAALMVETIVKLNEKIEQDGLDSRIIQSLTSLAKEARSSAVAMNTPQSTASMKELELGHALSFTQRLEGVFDGDDVILERVRSACKGIMIEIEGQY
jgi:hypothetical protein